MMSGIDKRLGIPKDNAPGIYESSNEFLKYGDGELHTHRFHYLIFYFIGNSDNSIEIEV